MHKYAHKKLVERILRLDQMPESEADFLDWITAKEHIQFLIDNAQYSELVLYANAPFSFVNSIVVPNETLFPVKKDDLLSWSGNPYSSIASYVYGGGREEMWIERTCSIHGSEVLSKGMDLIFGREFEGWAGKGRVYFEVNQEFAHLSGIHWRPEHSAYCNYDDNGDLDQVISVTTKDNSEATMVSLGWNKLEEYLAISQATLVRMFDFTLLNRSQFSSWSGGEEQVVTPTPELFYRQKIAGDAAYTHGVQIIRPRRSALEASEDVKMGWSGQKHQGFIEFIAHDWRNECIANISTDPTATTNYFEAEGNSLPFELSPAFFRPEVLSKYKTDREKYTLRDRGIECRASWTLRGYDVNEAGQVHVYICDLRALPRSEQLHWASFNEEPKVGISERAFANDFKGEFVTFQHPREEIIYLLSRWRDHDVYWWRLRDKGLLTRANPPLSPSREEWGTAFLDLSQLIAEGFETKIIRRVLDKLSIEYDKKDGSIALLRKLIAIRRGSPFEEVLSGIREVQRIRSKVKGHAGSSEGTEIADAALDQHGSYPEHFEVVCKKVVDDLNEIERVCDQIKIEH